MGIGYVYLTKTFGKDWLGYWYVTIALMFMMTESSFVTSPPGILLKLNSRERHVYYISHEDTVHNIQLNQP